MTSVWVLLFTIVTYPKYILYLKNDHRLLKVFGDQPSPEHTAVLSSAESRAQGWGR